MEKTMREYYRERPERRRAQGKCISCGNTAEPGKARCSECKAKRRKGGQDGKA